jgi:dUTP pyrophosphatase
MSPGSAGCDIEAALEQELVLGPGERAAVPSGLCFEIPQGYEVQVRPRSGLALKHGVTVLNAPGTIDSDYRGEVKVILVNHGSTPFTIRRGERIAQLVPALVAAEATFEETAEVNQTQRGSGGFGSSGN